MRGLRVAAVQLGLHRKPTEKALDEAKRLILRASAKGAELVCLPEHWLYYTILEERDAILVRFAALARDSGTHINLGGNFERRGDRTYMTSHTLSPDGVISRQDKIHLYRREKAIAVSGSRFELADVKGHKIGILVCHDVVFPEVARAETMKGAELLLVPSFITTEGIEPWTIYLKARALENRVPVVAPNVYSPPNLPGASTIIDLKYNRKEHIMKLAETKAPAALTSVLVDIDLNSKADLREERLDELRVGSHGEVL